MDDLFRQADKYSMLEDEVRAASQQVLVTNRPTKNNEARSSKPLNQSRQASNLQVDGLLTIRPRKHRAFIVRVQWSYNDFPRMKVIPSTYHQMVSYLMEEGQVDLLDSQLAACQCYQVVLDFR
ncbi:hypothetical protein AAG906_012023 [Vitis piasezkii]